MMTRTWARVFTVDGIFMAHGIVGGGVIFGDLSPVWFFVGLACVLVAAIWRADGFATDPTVRSAQDGGQS